MTTDLEKNEGQKTVVAFAVGLLVGGLLVWAFSGSPETSETPTANNEDSTEVSMDDTMGTDDTSTDDTNSTATDADVSMGDKSPVDPAPEMMIGDASISIGDVSAGSVVELEGAVFPTDEGWVGVRTYTDGAVGSILGVSRYSKEQGLIPNQIDLLASMVAGRDYAVVFFAEDGDRDFNPALDAQLDVAVTPFTEK